MGYKETTLTFHDDKITYFGHPLEGSGLPLEEFPEEAQELEVMMDWEASIMERSAEFVCENSGDILEIGFGMGTGKSNVTIVEGDWIDVISTLGKFDGIFYDTYGSFGHWGEVANRTAGHTNEGCHITFWNCWPSETNGCGFDNTYNVVYEQIPVDPVENTYFNHKTYFMPKVVV